MATFDTLKFVKKLTDKGVPREQAEAQAEALNEAITDNTQIMNSLATHQDVQASEKRLQLEMQVNTSELKAELIKWTLGIVLSVTTVQTAIILAFLKTCR